MFTASQIIAALLEKLGGGPVTLTIADVTKWRTTYPALLAGNEDGTEVVVSISAETFATNQKLEG